MADIHKFYGKQMIKRYSTYFSRLLMLILDMSEEQQLLLLKQAQQILEKRKESRKNCLIGAHYNIQDRNYTSFILDVNDFGAYIETDEHFLSGQSIDLVFFNPFSKKTFNLSSKIVWSKSGAMGVKFNGLNNHQGKLRNKIWFK